VKKRVLSEEHPVTVTKSDDVDFDEEEDELESIGPITAVVQSTDWTTETVVSQLRRGNILLNPKFQRRDAWNRKRKSLLIESLVVGLPVPQIVLAASKSEPGKFLVLDGKQRLLSILQFWGAAPDGPNNGFSLSALELRPSLSRKTFEQLSKDSRLEDDYNALCNHTIRTMVIKNWQTDDLLHAIFLRLNTGSVTLSPQELRQALYPGPFTNFIDEASANSKELQKILNLSSPDPRMRDAEILARYVAFHLFASDYPGRMKKFLDDSFDKLNKQWSKHQASVEEAVDNFNAGTDSLLSLFDNRPARKPDSTQFNRAIFDALIYFQSKPSIRTAVGNKKARIKRAYESLFSEGSEFLSAVESDTAGTPNTSARFSIWANALSKVTGKRVAPPKLPKKAA